MEKKFNRILSLALALIMVIGLVPMGHAHAAEATTKLVDFRWETTKGGTTLTNITEGYEPNGFTLVDGSIEGNYFRTVSGSFEQAINLKHDVEWAIEWSSYGDWNGMFLGSNRTDTEDSQYLLRNARGILALGIEDDPASGFNNFGVDTLVSTKESDKLNDFVPEFFTSFDFTEKVYHTFRLENRVAEDGSNMVFLLVDGAEIEDMDTYWKASVLQNSGADNAGLSGRDFVFTCLGVNASSQTLNKIYLEYLKIENATVALAHECDFQPTDDVKAGKDCMTPGTTVYQCTICGATESRENDVYGKHKMGSWTVGENNTVVNNCTVCEAVPQSDTLTTHHWEVVDNALVSETNPIKTVVAGEIVDGKFVGYQGELTDSVNLYNCVPWVVEWEAKGDWNGVLLSTNLENTIGMDILFKRGSEMGFTIGTNTGSFKNYGVEKSEVVDYLSDFNTWTLVNKVNEDGSNMVSLYIEDQFIGEMTKYFYGVTLQKNEDGTPVLDDYVNGVALEFNYFGKQGHLLNDMELKWMNVYEAGKNVEHTCNFQPTDDVTAGADCLTNGTTVYKCSICGETENRENDVKGEHNYSGDWYISGEEVRRDCSVCEASYESKALVHYRWEMLDNKLTTTGTTANAIDVTATNGTLDGVAGVGFNSAINLNADEEWYIEWQSNGNWTGFLLSNTSSASKSGNLYLYRNAKGYLVLGKVANGFNNYGIDTNLIADNISGFDLKASHIWTIKNEVADGVNTPVLYIDGERYAPMTNYWISSTYQSVTNGMNRENLTFGYLGAAGGDSFKVKGMDLQYLEIAPYGVAPAPCEHEMGPWVKGEGDTVVSTCAKCGKVSVTDTLTTHRWDMQDNALVSATNSIKEVIRGSIENGVLTGYNASLTDSIDLYHSVPWVIEWKAKGDWEGVLLGSHNKTTDGMDIVFKRGSTMGLTLGEAIGTTYYNYGVLKSDVSDDFAEMKVWSLRNEIDAEGNNQVYLYIDNELVGPMTRYFQGASDQKTTNDTWANGRDFTFNYIGKGDSTNHRVSKLELSYLQVWEAGKPADAPECEHEYGEFVNNNGTWESTCGLCGDVKVAQAVVGDAPAATLQDAVNAAEADATIKLLGDAEVADLTLNKGVTLDLNGKTLTAEYVTVNSTNKITDSTNGSGVLKVAKNSLIIPEDNGALPVYGDGGYRFVNTTKYQEKTSNVNDTSKFYFLPEMPVAVHQYLAAGADASGVNLKIKMSWTVDGEAGDVTLTYKPEHLAGVYAGSNTYAYAFALTITNADLADEGSLKFEPYFEAAQGVVMNLDVA